MQKGLYRKQIGKPNRFIRCLKWNELSVKTKTWAKKLIRKAERRSKHEMPVSDHND